VAYEWRKETHNGVVVRADGYVSRDKAMTDVLLVTGSRVLVDYEKAMRWAVAEISHELAAMPYVGVWTGDASGADAAAAQVAAQHDKQLARWTVAGEVVVGYGQTARDGGTTTFSRWTEATVPPRAGTPGDRALWAARCLARDRAMIAAAKKRGSVRVLALRAQWSTSGGTAYTVERAKAAGLVVIERLLTMRELDEA